MIQNEPQYRQARQALEHLETALAALRRRVEPANPELFKAMAQSYLSEIESIRREIDVFIGVANAEEARAPFWMILQGERLSASDISSQLLSEWLAKIRRALQNIGEYINTGKVLSGRPSIELNELTDPRIVALQHGSIKIGIRLPPPKAQTELFAENSQMPESLGQKALKRFLDVVVWIDSSKREFPRDQFPDSTEAIILVNQVSSLVPSRKGIVQTVRFSGALVPSPTGLYISHEALPRLRQVATTLIKTHNDHVEGVIREIDLDAQRIILRERGPERPDIKCYLPDELVEQVENLLDKHVRVYGQFTSISPDIIDVISIEEIH